jgi:hypothetical protein
MSLLKMSFSDAVNNVARKLTAIIFLEKRPSVEHKNKMLTNYTYWYLLLLIRNKLGIQHPSLTSMQLKTNWFYNENRTSDHEKFLSKSMLLHEPKNDLTVSLPRGHICQPTNIVSFFTSVSSTCWLCFLRIWRSLTKLNLLLVWYGLEKIFKFPPKMFVNSKVTRKII